MHSPYHVSSALSPARSTPYLDDDPLDYYESPPDDYLATPDLSEWRELRRLEDEKLRNDELAAMEASYQYELPSLDVLSHNQRPLLSELPPPLPSWPYLTIAPKDAFPDYQEVRKFLQEQARPPSPSELSSVSSSPLPYSTYLDNDLLPLSVDDDPCTHPSSQLRPCAEAQSTPSTSALSPTRPLTPPLPSRRLGIKVKREDDDDYAPTPKRRVPPPSVPRIPATPPSDVGDDDDDEDDDEDDVADIDDESGDFRPARRPAQLRRKVFSPRGTSRSTGGRPRQSAVRRTVTKPKSKSNRGESYQEGPCDCRDDKCLNCQMTCFYTFVHGPRKGQVCRRLFESGRHLDLKRHKATHAVQEWKWLEDGEITPEAAQWYNVVFEGKEHGLICPNGDCITFFTRYDALKRHMDRDTCPARPAKSPYEDLDNRQTKARIIRASDEKYKRFTASRAAGNNPT